MKKAYLIEDCERMSKEKPEVFAVPPAEELESLEAGDYVKLVFQNFDRSYGERMWVRISLREGGRFCGNLTEAPAFLSGIAHGDAILFESRHIANIMKASESVLK